MDRPSTPPNPVITSIDDVSTPSSMSINVTNSSSVLETATSSAPVTSQIRPTPAPSSTTTGGTTSTATTDKTTSISSSTRPNGPRHVECPDLFSTIDDDNNKGNNHHHTIIINNKNKAVIFNHQHSDDNNASDKNDNGTAIRINSRERTPGAIVTAICSHGTVPLTVSFLECKSDGKWNSTLPHCQGPLDLSSTTLYFSVIGGVCGLTVLILSVLYFLMMKNRRRDKGPLSPPLDPDRAVYVDPYAVGERLYSIPSPFHYQRGDIQYAKPQIYSTYLNPSFYEDVYQKWRKQEQQAPEKLYDAPFLNPRGSQAWPDNQDNKFCHIPRAKIASLDQASVQSQESTSTLTFTGPRPHRVLYGRQASVVSSHSTMPSRYGNCHAPRRQNSQLEAPVGLHLVKAFDDAPPPSFPGMDDDHRTPF